MVGDGNLDFVEKCNRWPCSVCGRGVGRNSIPCTNVVVGFTKDDMAWKAWGKLQKMDLFVRSAVEETWWEY